MDIETITIVELNGYDGKYSKIAEVLYFKKEKDAKHFLMKEGYKEDDVFGKIIYTKDYFYKATIKQGKLQ